jgi:hypothetical protein
MRCLNSLPGRTVASLWLCPFFIPVSVRWPRNESRGSIVSPGLWLPLQRTFLQWCSHSVHSNDKWQAFWAGWHRPEEIVIAGWKRGTFYRRYTTHPSDFFPWPNYSADMCNSYSFTITLLSYRHVPLHRYEEFLPLPNTADLGPGMLISARNRPPLWLSVGATMPPHGWRQGGGVGGGTGAVTCWRRSKEMICCSILSRIAHSQAWRFSENGDWQLAEYQVDLVKVRSNLLFPPHPDAESFVIICHSVHVFGFKVQNSELCWTNSTRAQKRNLAVTLLKF